MNIKDYIHYYINSDVYLCNNIEGKPVIEKLTAKMAEEDIDMFESETRPYKLLLRRLEDMTEEEIRGLYRAKGLWADLPDSHIQFLSFNNHNKNQIDVKYDGPSGSGGWRCGVAHMFLNQLFPTQFHYLLKMYFDLFGLIDAGLAIDSKTINK